MTIDIREKVFENQIENVLLDGGYVKRLAENFDRTVALDTENLIHFLKQSQPEPWRKLEEIYGLGVEHEIKRKLLDELEDLGMIHVLRNGFRISKVHFDCAYFKPVSKRNPELEIQYNNNILSVIRQVPYSKDNNGKKVDLLLFVNGLPVATAEIKNPATGQYYVDAIKQYKQDRDPKEKLFEFNKRAFIHFAIDPHEIYMTTRLDGDKTIFLPFNKGRNEGAGNPDDPNSSYRTSYLCENIWQKDTWLDIIADFVNIKVKEQKLPAPAQKDIIFPRYHQHEAVIQLTKDTK